jgi:hypothetical protein
LNGYQAASMESSDGPCPHRGDPAVVSAKKLRRAMRAVYLVLIKKHQPKLAALGVHLLHMLSYKRHRRKARGHSALTYVSSLSCRSMDPAAAVVHPLPRDACGGHRRKSSFGATALPSLSCRSMDPEAAVHQYRPREVQFSCKSTPPRKRRRAQRRTLRQQHAAADHPLELEYHGSAAAVTRLFELMDVEEAAGVDFDDDGDLLDVEEAAAAWPVLSPAPRQVRITDSPFPLREEEDDRLVDKRADEFITWFHEQLRAQLLVEPYAAWVR